MSVTTNVDMKTVFWNQILQTAGTIVFTATSGLNSIWDSNSSSEQTVSTPAEPETAPEPNEPPKKSADEIKQEVLNILKNNPNVKVDFKGEDGKLILDAAVRKYDAMKAQNPNITDAEVSRRLGNYVNGYIYHQGEYKFGLQQLGEVIGVDTGYSNYVLANPDIKDAVDKGDMNAYKEAFHQQAREYIEFYDENGNGKIDYTELAATEVCNAIDEYAQSLTKEQKNDIKQKVREKMEYIAAKEIISRGKIDIADLAEKAVSAILKKYGQSLSEDEIDIIKHELYNVDMKIATLDKNNDNKLDENEISGYHWARNNLYGQGYNMTYQEYDEFETAMLNWSNLPEELIDAGNKCAAVLKKYNLTVGSLGQKSLDRLTPEERNIVYEGLEFMKVKVALQAYDNGYEGLSS